MSETPRPVSEGLFLPDFCSIRAVFAVVVVGELFAVVLALMSAGLRDIWQVLSLTSLFVQWVVLMSAAVLCISRPVLRKMTNPQIVIVSYVLLLLVTYLVSEVAVAIFEHYGMQPVNNSRWHTEFLWRNLGISAVISALLLRYLYVQHQWRQRLQSEAQARIQALQARIRPHFLFNSMNVIASLTRSQPDRAEAAIEDLADLFRASLADPSQGISLDEELDICRRYLRMEELRLGDRLQVQWQIEVLPGDALIPALIIQPLLENAIYHGIETRREGGCINISGILQGKRITITVTNPADESNGVSSHEGNRMAMENIRQRLEVFYERPGSLLVEEQDDHYAVILNFPYVTEIE